VEDKSINRNSRVEQTEEDTKIETMWREAERSLRVVASQVVKCISGSLSAEKCNENNFNFG
jgi:hypothetical protein